MTFIEWLIKDTKSYDKGTMASFLHMVKNDPDQVKRLIAANLLDWQTIYAYKMGGAVLNGPGCDWPERILAAYQEHYKAKLEALA